MAVQKRHLSLLRNYRDSWGWRCPLLPEGVSVGEPHQPVDGQGHYPEHEMQRRHPDYAASAARGVDFPGLSDGNVGMITAGPEQVSVHARACMWPPRCPGGDRWRLSRHGFRPRFPAG